MVSFGLYWVNCVLWGLGYFCRLWGIVSEVGLLGPVGIKCTLGFRATSSACWELYLQYNIWSTWFDWCTLGLGVLLQTLGYCIRSGIAGTCGYKVYSGVSGYFIGLLGVVFAVEYLVYLVRLVYSGALG